MESFMRKGRFTELMERIPIHIATARAALVGAAAIPDYLIGEFNGGSSAADKYIGMATARLRGGRYQGVLRQ